MKKLLVTGGTVFVSRYLSEYFVKKGFEVYVLNRGTKKQSDGVIPIVADRNNLGEMFKSYRFDSVLDITAYNKNDISSLLQALGSFENYIMVSSSAVYPETAKQPFAEEEQLGINKFWGKYGTDKIEAEEELVKNAPNAYILRPPYLYGKMNNVYREAFVFDCAMAKRTFYLPKDGSMKLQFFNVDDLCRFIERILEKKPKQHIFNVGNKEQITVLDWVKACYKAVGEEPRFIEVASHINQRSYFSFYDYEYCLDVKKQYELLDNVKDFNKGLKESFEWYVGNKDKVAERPYLKFIDNNFM